MRTVGAVSSTRHSKDPILLAAGSAAVGRSSVNDGRRMIGAVGMMASRNGRSSSRSRRNWISKSSKRTSRNGVQGCWSRRMVEQQVW